MKRSPAFSLVELSIVLVILGLLTGGILAGRSLVRASELRAVSTEHGRYVTAVHAFRQKYFQLPGDITNATSLWGTAAACPGLAAEGSTDATTCNGNGNNLVYGSTNSTEMFRFWQHLANAGLIEGSYSGVTTADSYNFIAGTANSPASKLSQARWNVISANNTAGAYSSAYWLYNYGNHFIFAGTTAASWPSAAVLVPEEAWNVDTKLDDGKPFGGKLHGYATNSCTDAADNTATNPVYNLTRTAKSCALLFPNAF